MISFVIPVKDEERTLVTLHAELGEMIARERLDAELIFVDDGSTDGSWAQIAALAQGDPAVRAVRFRRNFGKAAALTAGFAHVRGDLVFTLDADLQDDPHELPKFLRLLNEGYDMVSGWKRVRHDPWHKVWPSRVFNKMIGWFTGLHLHDNVCGFKGCRTAVAREVELYGEMHRFFAVRAFALGFKVTEIEVNHRPREYGHSKYGVTRFVKGFLDLLTNWFVMRYGRRPLHFFGSVGLAVMTVGGVMGLVSLLRALDGEVFVLGAGFWTGLILAAFGLQWIGIGLLAEHRLARTPQRGAHYSVAETIGIHEIETASSSSGPVPQPAETTREP